MNIVQAKADVHSALHDSIHARSVLLCRYVTLNLNQRQASVSFPQHITPAALTAKLAAVALLTLPAAIVFAPVSSHLAADSWHPQTAWNMPNRNLLLVAGNGNWHELKACSTN